LNTHVGIAAAPTVFQQTMDTVLQGLLGIVFYLDNIVTGKDKAEHLLNLEKVLSRIQEYGFRVCKEKCFFIQDSVEYLGHIVDKNGIQVSPKKVKAIAKMLQPTNLAQLRTFLGMVNHYGKFIPKLSEMCSPLNHLLQKSVKWKWTNECKKVVQQIKETLMSSEALVHYNSSFVFGCRRLISGHWCCTFSLL